MEAGGIEDHVHLLVSGEPTLTLSEFIGQLKGSTSYEINRARWLPNHFQWGEGYGVLSLAKRGTDAVRRYIRRQREHHATESYVEIMERCDKSDNYRPEGPRLRNNPRERGLPQNKNAVLPSPD